MLCCCQNINRQFSNLNPIFPFNSDKSHILQVSHYEKFNNNNNNNNNNNDSGHNSPLRAVNKHLYAAANAHGL